MTYDNTGRLSTLNGQKAGQANKTYLTVNGYTTQGALQQYTFGNLVLRQNGFTNSLQQQSSFVDYYGGVADASKQLLNASLDWGGSNNCSDRGSRACRLGAGPQRTVARRAGESGEAEATLRLSATACSARQTRARQ